MGKVPADPEQNLLRRAVLGSFNPLKFSVFSVALY
jgi:hypothetical protein